MIVIVIGVAGSGKTTIGALLAAAMQCAFLEGDSLHSPENIDKMRRGIALTDTERGPWLSAIRARVLDAFESGGDLVVSCSALKHEYRRTLSRDVSIHWVYLKASPALIRARLRARTNHFMKVEMLESQFEALEEPCDAIVVDADEPPMTIVERVLVRLRDTT
jgi:gluconokinase